MKKFPIFNFQFSVLLQGFLFLALALLAIIGWLAIFAPSPYRPPTEPFSDYALDGIQAAMAPKAVQEQLDEIAALGHRFLGSQGFYDCEALIRHRYTDAGLELHEQSIRTVAPKTEFADALNADGTPAAFKVYPFMPNHFQPVATPDAGITATVLKVDDELLRTRQSFSGCFALLDSSSPPPPGYGYDYTKYAQLGFEGVLVSHPEGLEEVPWSLVDKMVTLNPVNYLRVAADAAVFNAIGQTVTLRVRVRYRHVLNRTVVGVMKGTDSRAEALIVPCSYDALSMLPDHSPGLMQALPIAIQLQLLDGLRSHRSSLQRDVIFVAFGGHMMAQHSQAEFLAAIGARYHQQLRRADMESELAGHGAKLAIIRKGLAAMAAPDVLLQPDPTRRALTTLDADGLAFFESQVQYVLDTRSLELSETVLRAKMAFEKGAVSDTDSPEFLAYRAAKIGYDKSFSASGLGPVRLLREQADVARDMALRERVLQRLNDLQAYHEEQSTSIEQSLDINAVFARYEKLIVFSPELAASADEPGGTETLTFSMGLDTDHSAGSQPAYNAIRAAIQRLDLEDKVKLRFTAKPGYGREMHDRLSKLLVESALWAGVGYPAYSLVHPDRSYKAASDPVALPWMRNTDSLAGGLAVFGATALSLGYGNESFTPLKFHRMGVVEYSGNVFVANVGQSIIPSYPHANALVGCKSVGACHARGRILVEAPTGWFSAQLDMTDPYGRYERRYALGSFAGSVWDYGPDAIGFDEQGVISLIKDEGPSAQRLYLSMHLKHFTDVNIICYRAAPVTLLDMINPQSLKSYTGATFVRRLGLSPFENTYETHPQVVGKEGIMTTFIKPDEYFYVELKAGAADNELVRKTRAFLLGSDKDAERGRSGTTSLMTRPGSEIRGQGYLAGETPLIRDVATESARSMIAVNSQRLALQNHYGMADERTRDFQDRAVQNLERAESAEISHKRAALSARDSVTYSTLNHPVLRRNIAEAVAGILWYLGLLVPFTFFFEKLVFGYPDVRKQLGAHVVIFLTAFLLLKWLHPAFAMIRSSLMILLGFVILLISTGILALFSSRFKENLEILKKQRGQVTAAEVNKAGAMATAFMLGLNNMHRRRVRTMLTCGTLVLITFVMICFTSVQSDLVDSSVAIGKAPFQGFVVKNEQYRPVSESELFALKTKYGERYAVVARRAIIGKEDHAAARRVYPEIRLARHDGERTHVVEAHSVLTWSPEEPLARYLMPQARWFKATEATDVNVPAPLLISRTMAAKLKVTEAMLDGDEAVSIEVNGINCRVRGIFDGSVLDGLMDFDGYNLLPFDIKALREMNSAGSFGQIGGIIAEPEDPRISGDDVIIAPRSLGLTVAPGQERILSVAVVLPDSLPPKQVREEIEQFMEQSARQTYFGLDGYAFLGKRARESSFVGLIDMLIPLIIAAITVLNTIRGSVYERKEEIFVYNAVGIAPRHIFFMFFAEAFVYAVVGSVLGYILSQGTGKLLTAVNLTGGLNMTFTSLGTIYASLTIAASVFISTGFPAWTAMKIASPSTDQGWRLPEPDGDVLSFKLPFTFDWHDRIAVLAFFRRYFTDHGEGSSGKFFAGPSELGVEEETDPLNNDGYIPSLSIRIWLKPFDLGVSQDLHIMLPTDPETGEYVAQVSLTRLSGKMQDWKRLNRLFVSLLRTHFLHWRAVTPEERKPMFTEAREQLNIEC